MDGFNGKAELIAGGTSGLALATAKLSIKEGAQVIVTGRSQRESGANLQRLRPPQSRAFGRRRLVSILSGSRSGAEP
jgi:NAD(P)-dependent dehydrogenase (short-subunit alcohol dehydrogenase family)